MIGGAAGAVPVLVGWSAVTDRLDWAPIVLFAVIFYWTPPHFWALAIQYKRRLRRRRRARCCRRWPACATTASRILVYTLRAVGADRAVQPGRAAWAHLYLVSAHRARRGVHLAWPLQLLRGRHSAPPAMRLFAYSITYITLLFGAMAVDQLLRT